MSKPLERTDCQHCQSHITWREVRRAELLLIKQGVSPGRILAVSPLCKACAQEKIRVGVI